VAAWAAGDQGRLDQLRASANQVFQTLSAGNYDKHFGLYQCTGAAGSSVCAFYNNAGDELDLRLSNQLLGQPHAVTDGKFQPITFPADAQAYAQEALDAWINHNSARLGLLASPDGVSHLNAIAAGYRTAAWHFDHGEGAAGSSYLVWKDDAGDAISFRFLNAGIAPSTGPQHRIVDVVLQPHT
jgi:hypothetical protein